MEKVSAQFKDVKMYQVVNGGCMLCFELDRQQSEKMQNAVSTAVERLKQGKTLQITISESKNKRSLDENAYFHVLVGEIAKKLHTSIDEVKRKMVFSYGVSAFIAIQPKGEDITKLWNYAQYLDDLDDGSQRFILYKATHEMNTAEMARLIEGTISEAKELGIQTETPEELAKMGVEKWENL